MATIRQFEDLPIWQGARRLAKSAFRAVDTRAFRRWPEFQQDMVGNAVRAMNNVAEGFDRGSDREFAQYLKVARSTWGELRSQCYAAFDQQLISEEDFRALVRECFNLGAQATGLIAYLQRRAIRGTRGIPPEADHR